jgi:hypothetical protein
LRTPKNQRAVRDVRVWFRVAASLPGFPEREEQEDRKTAKEKFKKIFPLAFPSSRLPVPLFF